MIEALAEAPGGGQGLAPAAGLTFGERRLDLFFGPMRPGEMVFLEGSSMVGGAADLAAVSALLEPEGRVVWVDGCCRSDPYALVKLCRRFRLDPDDALSRVDVCRAFTAYQMSSIIEDQLEERARGARLLVVFGLQELYRDKDVWYKEADVLVRRACEKLALLTRVFGLVTFVTDTSGGGKPDFRGHIMDHSSRHLRFGRWGRRMRLFDETAGRSADYLPVPIFQTILDEFWVV